MVTRTRLTLEEFLALPEIDERRLELIDGDVYEKMSPRWGHSELPCASGPGSTRSGLPEWSRAS